MMPETYELFKDGAMAAGVLWAFWWMLTKYVPSREAAFEKQLAQQREDFLVQLKDDKDIKQQMIAALARNTEMMAAHDRMFSENVPSCMRGEQ
jgi:hypothetical protein